MRMTQTAYLSSFKLTHLESVDPYFPTQPERLLQVNVAPKQSASNNRNLLTDIFPFG